MHVPPSGPKRLTRVVTAALVALAALLALASSAMGAPQTQTFIGNQPGTPNIERTDLLYFTPSGAQASTGAAGTINLALDGRPVVAYCLRVGNPLNRAPVVSNVNPVQLPTADDRAVLWILQNQTPTGLVTPEKQQQAAAAQVAIWVIRGQVRAGAPTNDPALNAAVAQLVATARAQSATPASLALTGTAGPAGTKTATIGITAKPGAIVALAVTSGPGTLSSTSVTAGSDGKASVTVSSPGGGTAVSATTAGDGTLLEIDPVDGSQNTAISAGSQLTAGVTVSETAASARAVTTVTQVQGSLRVTKTAAARAKAMSRVRYSITVRNSGRIDVRNVLLRDRFPSGMSFVKASRRGTVQSGGIRWELGTLRPGASRTVTVWLLASASVRGTRTNVATVSATGVRPARARVVTVFQTVQRQIRPAVTG